MLVIKRKRNESVLVNGPCRITALDHPCKLGFVGSAKVLRSELVPHGSMSNTVYLVDDDCDLLQAYDRYLAHFGFSVHAFDHGADFLQHAQHDGHASAAVLDLRLAEEDIDGLQILQQLKAWQHDYPVILLTGYGDVETCRRAFHGGCYTFLQKPIAPKDLAATVKEASSRYQQGELGGHYAFARPAC